MRVIDLLNKIANEEEVPKEIKYNACLFAFERQSQDYYCEEYGNLFEYLINEHRTGEFLNEEVEIIEDKPFNKRVEELYNRHIDYIYSEEDKKIEKLREPFLQEETLNYVKLLKSKINEIIDYLEEK